MSFQNAKKKTEIRSKKATEDDSMSPYKRLQQKVTKQNLVLLVKRFVIAVIAVFLSFLLFNFIFPLPDKTEYSTIIRDSKGDLINAYLTSDEKWRMKT
ncbi:MAG: hypothetical protein ABR503_08600, partial [Chitinophagaceae bacterium]